VYTPSYFTYKIFICIDAKAPTYKSVKVAISFYVIGGAALFALYANQTPRSGRLFVVNKQQKHRAP
jgi:hypothetical protein